MTKIIRCKGCKVCSRRILDDDDVCFTNDGCIHMECVVNAWGWMFNLLEEIPQVSFES